MLPGTAIPSASIAELIVLAVNIPPKKNMIHYKVAISLTASMLHPLIKYPPTH